MSRGYRNKTVKHKAVKSTRKQVKLGYGETNKNINTLRKIEQFDYEQNLKDELTRQ